LSPSLGAIGAAIAASAIEKANPMQRMQQVATQMLHLQRDALELLQLGYRDIEIAQSICSRNETVWRWNHRDSEFLAELGSLRAPETDAAGE
jgi:hypothetical protein